MRRQRIPVAPLIAIGVLMLAIVAVVAFLFFRLGQKTPVPETGPAVGSVQTFVETAPSGREGFITVSGSGNDYTNKIMSAISSFTIKSDWLFAEGATSRVYMQLLIGDTLDVAILTEPDDTFVGVRITSSLSYDEADDIGKVVAGIASTVLAEMDPLGDDISLDMDIIADAVNLKEDMRKVRSAYAYTIEQVVDEGVMSLVIVYPPSVG